MGRGRVAGSPALRPPPSALRDALQDAARRQPPSARSVLAKVKKASRRAEGCGGARRVQGGAREGRGVRSFPQGPPSRLTLREVTRCHLSSDQRTAPWICLRRRRAQAGRVAGAWQGPTLRVFQTGVAESSPWWAAHEADARAWDPKAGRAGKGAASGDWVGRHVLAPAPAGWDRPQSICAPGPSRARGDTSQLSQLHGGHLLGHMPFPSRRENSPNLFPGTYQK